MVFMAMVLASPLGSAQSSFQKIDIEPGVVGADSLPTALANTPPAFTWGQFSVLGSEAFFFATSPTTGTELYKTDGTALGTQLVADLSPGLADTQFVDAEVMGGLLYFSASVGGTSFEIWVTDGTAVGTHVVTALGAAVPAKGPRELTAVGNQLFFRAESPGVGRELMVTDGTAAGTHLVLDIYPGVNSSEPRNLIKSPTANVLLFGADDQTHGEELWSSDGTAVGTSMVVDLAPGFLHGSFRSPVVLGSKILFNGLTAATGSELFVTDGTAAGTSLVADIFTGPLSSSLELSPDGVLGGTLYFAGRGVGTGLELYRTDGTPAGTSLVADLALGSASSSPKPLGATGGKLMVSAMASTVLGSELYGADSTGLTLVSDVNPLGSSTPRSGFEFGSQLLFIGTDGIFGESLFVTDGTAAGTQSLAEFIPSPGDPQAWLTGLGAGRVVFSAKTVTSGAELFLTDGTSAGTGLLVDFAPAATPISSLPSGLACVDGERLILSANPALFGLPSAYQWSEASGIDYLYGIAEGAFLPLSFRPAWFTDHEQSLFLASDLSAGIFQAGLFSTDGTAAGSKNLDLFGSGTFFPDPLHSPYLGGDGQRMLFPLNDAAHGVEPWITDGSVGGSLLLDVEPGPVGSDPYAGIAFDGGVFFVAKHGSPGEALWRADAGVVSLVADLNSSGSASVQSMTIAGSELFFVADDGVHGSEVWISDGTAVGTHLVADVNPGAPDSQALGLVPFGGKLHFFAEDVTGAGSDLWSTDGSTVGTVKVATLGLVEDPDAVAVGAFLLFEGADPAHGDELWFYDGVNVGLVADLNPGTSGSAIGEKLVVSDRVYFVASTTNAGTEVFVSDGTPAGTHVALDLASGSASSDPVDLVLCKGDVFFIGTDSTGDRELFRIQTQGASVLDLGYGLAGAHLTATAPVLGQLGVTALEGAPANAVSFLALSAPTAPTSLLIAPGVASWIDPVSFQILGVFAGTSWSLPSAIPSTPALAGVAIDLQAWFLMPSGFPAETSNGLRLVFGN
jgi:ELWxxDGT repeat protein